MSATRIVNLLSASSAASFVGQQVLIQGWVRTRRDSKGGFSFLEVNDGSALASLQVIADQKLANYESEILKIGVGACVTVRGTVVESKGQKQAIELSAEEVTVLGSADATYPLQKKGHSLEFLRSIAHLRARTNTFGAVARVRSAMAFAIHDYFRKNGFVYLHTPIITASDCEGAGAMFRVSTLDPEKLPRTPQGSVDFSQDFFSRATSLTVSGQLEAETYALALGKVYTFGPTFRAENSNTSRHLAEFWMVEPEMAFFDLDMNAALAEDFLKTVLRTVLVGCPEDMGFLASRADYPVHETLQHIIESPFERLSYTDAVAILQKSGKKFDYPVAWGQPLQTEHERFLTEQEFKRPVIVTGYPKEFTAFYMRLNEDGKTVRAMDVLVPRIGEIIGGSQREERYDRLVARMQEAGLNTAEYEWYLATRRYGSAPHAGFGLGFERLIQFATGMENIRDVIPFPRYPQHAEF
ncbi:MAG: asparagine--tRNA ligase [Myxococcales bacterium]|nr:asparagine--tRNA ligase [Myxococcales bacterium]